MKVSIAAAVAVGAAVALLTAGCGGDKSSTASSSSSSKSSTASSSAAESSTSESAPADAKDYSTLLIDAADITFPGDVFTAQEPMIDPGGTPGAATVFSNEGDTREIGDTILVLPDEAAAATAIEGAAGNIGMNVTGGTPASANVGSDSVIVAGTSPDGAKEVTVLLFTQGRAFVTLQFDSAAGDPVPAEAATGIANQQAQKIADGLG